MTSVEEQPQAKPATPDQSWRPKHNPWAIALTVTIATFMEVMDSSIANVALPHIAGGLSSGEDEATWVLTSYLVSNAAVLPISAWLADRFGRKRFYMTCVALFTISSFLCGLAPTLGLLIFFRVLQGLGGGGLGPSEQAILADTFPPAKRGMAFAVYGMAVVLAPAIGPTLGGFITDSFSWRWIFYVNVPFGILSLFLANFMVEDPPHLVEAKKKAERTGVDFLGLVLIAASLGCVQVVLDKGQRDDWFSSHLILSFTVISASALIVFIFWELRHPHPIVNLQLFRNRNYATANLLMFLLGAVLLGTTVLIPQFLQTLLGYTAQRAGEVLTPGGFAVLLLLPIVGILVSKVDARFLIAFGFLITGLALLNMSRINLAISFDTAVRWRIYQAAGLAFLFVPINTISYVGIPMRENNQVSGMVNLMRNMGSSVGISFVTTTLARHQQTHQNFLVEHVNSGNPIYRNLVNGLASHLSTAGSGTQTAMNQSVGQVYRMVQQQASVLAYSDIIWIFSAVSFAAVPLVFLTRRNRPGQASMGH
ncbi:MAG: DHA2 family efflux MFS transporter permease subunit [Acidobacteriota bacterium]|nr:DHA2 family efflux MFS transporter permease subunit [Acidobacteriota bacterium]